MNIPSSLLPSRIAAIFALAVPPLTLAQPNEAEQKRKAVTAIAARELTVDGDLSEPAWQAGPWYGGFTVPGSTDLASPSTRFAVRFDDSRLYVGVIAGEPNTAAIRHAATSRDGRIFRDDCVEFMIDPTGDRVRYYHFAVSASGAFYDAERRQGGHVVSKEWNSSASVAARIGQQDFSVEVGIPLVELGLAAHSATQVWAIQVARERHAGGKLELSSYIQCGGSFHVPTTYAPLTLKDAKLTRFLWEIGDPLEQLVTRENGELVVHFQVLIRNLTDRFHFTQVTASLPDGEATSDAIRTGGHDAGQQQTYRVALRVPKAGDQNLCLTVADREAPDVPLSVRYIPVSLDYSPVRLRVTDPGYRNTIYATQNLSEIVTEVELSLPDEGIKGAAIAGSLVPAGQRAPALATGKTAASGRKSQLTIPLPDLEVGSYDLRVTVATTGGAAYSAQARIRKVARVDHEWRFDENLVALHNGEPFMPYGWFSASMDDAEQLLDEGVTAVQAYNSQYRSTEDVRAWLDKLQEHGLYACLYPWPSSAFMKNFREPVSPKEEQLVRERIRALRDHPALLGYYMWDEPELRPMLVARSDRLYEIVAEEDPYHPCIMLNDTIRGIHDYRNGGDVLMPDPYPLFNKGSLAGRPIEYTSKFMHACREASLGQKAWWVTPQAFDYYMGNKPNSRPPTFTELRNQQLQAFINGARGILWYTYSHRHNYESLDLGVPFLGREARTVQAAILAPEQPGAITWTADRPKHIQAAVRTVGSHTIIFTVNTATAPQEAQFSVRGLTADTLHVLAEERTVAVVRGRFSDAFELYGGHIYTTDPALATGPTLAQTQGAIERAKTLRHRPGNLAYRELGTRVTHSSISPYSGKPSMVVDGRRKGKGWRDKTWRRWPDWVQVNFPEPVTAGRVLVFSGSTRDYAIQVSAEGRLVTVAMGTRTDGEPIRAEFEPVVTDAVRVVISSSSGTGSGVSEIEVYEK